VKKKVKVVITSLIVFLVVGTFAGFYLHRLQTNELRNQTIFFTVFNSCAKHRPQDKNYQPFLDSQNIPCYQNALKAGPDKSFEFMLASLLLKQRRYSEARPLLVDVAHPGVFGMLFRQTRTTEAKRLLQPGAMEKEQAGMIRSDQAQRDLIVISAKNNQEESDFLKLHATMDGMKIIHMSDADKVVWLRMREQHDQQQRALARM
jgi:uncharacterized protein YxeA